MLQAIAEYDDLGRTPFLKRYGYRKARSYFLRFEGKQYDSKAIVGAAHKYIDSAAGPLKAAEFSGGDATVVQLLERLGFEIEGSLSPHASPAHWWVNHKQTFSQEVGGNYLWSPLTRSDGGRNEFYENMKRVRPGDIVFSFADTQIKAVGVCQAPACLAPKPEEFGTAGNLWKDTGWQLPSNVFALARSFARYRCSSTIPATSRIWTLTAKIMPQIRRDMRPCAGPIQLGCRTIPIPEIHGSWPMHFGCMNLAIEFDFLVALAAEVAIARLTLGQI